MGYILIDTDILIDITNNDVIAQNRLAIESQNANLGISTITLMELVVGCRNKAESQALNRFLEQFTVMYLNQEISRQAVELIQIYNLSHGLMIPDALIAATAIYNNISLLTKNQRDYRFIPSIQLLPYPL